MLRYAAIAAFLASWGFAADQPKPPRKTDTLQWQAEFRWGGFISTTPVKSFTNIPAAYRTVPWHPDDDYSGARTTTIPDYAIKPSRLMMWDYAFTTGVLIKERVTLRGGVGVGFSGGDSVGGPGNNDRFRSVNIYSDTFERGAGTSLVYYVIKHEDWGEKMPFFFPEAEVRLGPIGVLGGWWTRNYHYIIERGYDRWNSLELLERLPLAQTRLHHPYVGLRLAYWAQMEDDPGIAGVIGGLLFTAGPTIVRTRPDPLVQSVQLGNHTGWMFGLSMHFGGPLKRVGRDPAYRDR